MRGNILYRLINSGVLQSAQFYLFRWLFWRTQSTLKIAKSSPPTINTRERSGSVVECLTRDRGAAGSSLTGVTALWSLSKTHLS